MFKKLSKVVISAALLAVSVSCAPNINQGSPAPLASLSAPTVGGIAYKGCNYVQWMPVSNATGYQLFRYSGNTGKLLGKFDKSNPVFEYFDIVTHDNELENGKDYKYIVVATGVQANRSAAVNAQTTVGNTIVMDDTTILGDAQGSVTLKANIPEEGTKVEGVSNISVKVADGSIKFGYKLPDFNKAYLLSTGKSLAKVKLYHKSTGIDVEDSDFFADNIEIPCGKAGAFAPQFPGTYGYTVTTSWPNCQDVIDSFYEKNVSDEYTFFVPAANLALPSISITNEYNRQRITFTDYNNAEYKVFVCCEADSNDVYDFKELESPQQKVLSVVNGKERYDYTIYNDKVEFGKKYLYVLTGTKNGAALSYTNGCKASSTFSNVIVWDPQFAAYNNDGNVSLSWKNEGYNYKVLRQISFTDNSVTTTESEVSLENAVTVNDVTYVTDTINKLDVKGVYTYKLIAYTSDGKLGEVATSDSIAYNVSAKNISITSVTGIDTPDATGEKNGRKDTIRIEVSASNELKAPVFHIAQVRPSDSNHGLRIDNNTYYEYVSAYKAIEPTEVVEERVISSNTTKYVYTLKADNEDDLAYNYYAISAKSEDLSAISIYKDCAETINLNKHRFTFGYTGINNVKSRTYTLSLDVMYSALTSYERDPDLSPYAADIKFEAAYSSKPINEITDWEEIDMKFKDGLYLSDIVVSGHEDSTRFYARVVYKNATNEKQLIASVDNPGYIPEVTNHGITGITVKTVYTSRANTAEKDSFIVFTTNGAKDLDPSKYTVYITPIDANNKINGIPEKIATNTVFKVLDITNASGTHLNGTVNEDNPSYYFARGSYSDKVKYPVLLIHITDDDGFTYRTATITNW